jgi:pimeloyl-ACP methyl ester carboxylesterase/Fe-S cluster biogenesis protein NfuA
MVAWSSSNGSVATVGSSGLVTGVGSGSATVTATCEGKSGTATVTVPAYALAVSKDGSGTGRVTSNPGGIDCGSSCSATFGSGVTVALTASPSQGSVFVEWKGACAGVDPTCQVTLSEDRSVTATFDLIPTETHTLTVWKSGTGSGTVVSSPAGIDCGSTCSRDFAGGSVVTLTATPASGSVFVQWSGACAGRERSCEVTVGRDRLAMVEFRLPQGPHVVSTYPEDGDRGVDPWLETLEVEFSEPMARCGLVTSGWYPATYSWSADKKTLYYTRDNASTPLFGKRVTVQTMDEYCVNLEDEPLDVGHGFEFYTEYRNPPIRVGADAASGFNWPYFLVLPEQMQTPNTLLVEPNNTGTWSDDLQFHEDAARNNIVHWRIPFADSLGCAYLVPIFPRPVNPPAPEPGGIYTHALDRYSLSEDYPGLERIDLQMVAMIDDALDRLDDLGYEMDRRVFMMGFSASGAFTSRFSLLHPDRIKAAAAGSPGGWPLAPLASWQGTPLKYAIGIMDLEALIGQPFELETFRTVPLYIFVGDADTNDAFDVRGMSPSEREQIYDLLNWPEDLILAHRWPLAQAMYQSVGANAQFVVYPGVTHVMTPGMWDDVKAFFQANR